MIELFYSPTPNGRKISIMLEETKIEYKITSINLGKEEQFKPEFLKINPYGKIPAIIDHEKDLVIIESGAILIYLARKSNQFLPKENEIRIFEWLMFQISNVGPTLGQLHHFSHFNPGKSLYSEERFYKGALKVYAALNNQLKKNNFNIPITLFHGLKDEVVPLKFSIKIFKNCINTKKKLIKVKNGNHSLSRKGDLKKICSELNNMISKHC